MRREADIRPKGYFITFEGGEGSGKSTQVERLRAALASEGHDVLATREPGGSPGADALRHIILSGAVEALGPDLEAILFAAARSDHVTTAIAPALEDGAIVVCDRFIDSTRVYQGLDPAIDDDLLAALERAALSGTYPDLTIILDIDAETGLARAAARRGTAGADRYERQDVSVHEARRQAFLTIAAKESERCVVVDARRAPEEIANEVAMIVEDRLQAARLERLGRSLSAQSAPMRRQSS
ncbi:dTMP kinase [Mangrovicella endophytica]|uniref:dTMP kinase n=1 Tax=Mangrovicella endophytica TaxID=2066697 RepID=UPI000C9E1F5F|nr:dTMP kinase [Mangrovicella endophytica]